MLQSVTTISADEGATDGNADFDDGDFGAVEATADENSSDLDVIAGDETRAPCNPNSMAAIGRI